MTIWPHRPVLQDLKWNTLCSSPEKLPASSAAGRSRLLSWDTREQKLSAQISKKSWRCEDAEKWRSRLTRSSISTPPRQTLVWWSHDDASPFPAAVSSPPPSNTHVRHSDQLTGAKTKEATSLSDGEVGDESERGAVDAAHVHSGASDSQNFIHSVYSSPVIKNDKTKEN